MPLFEYKAVAPSGETVQGTMEAASVDLVSSETPGSREYPVTSEGIRNRRLFGLSCFAAWTARHERSAKSGNLPNSYQRYWSPGCHSTARYRSCWSYPKMNG